MKEGDKVTLNKNSQYYNPLYSVEDHPIKTVGTLYHKSGDDLNFVKWPNGRKSVYSTHDLDLVNEEPPSIPTNGCTCDRWQMFNRGCTCEGGQAELERERK